MHNKPYALKGGQGGLLLTPSGVSALLLSALGSPCSFGAPNAIELIAASASQRRDTARSGRPEPLGGIAFARQGGRNSSDRGFEQTVESCAGLQPGSISVQGR